MEMIGLSTEKCLESLEERGILCGECRNGFQLQSGGFRNGMLALANGQLSVGLAALGVGAALFVGVVFAAFIPRVCVLKIRGLVEPA
jgi:hypothetical protein